METKANDLEETTRNAMIDKLNAIPEDILENSYVTTFESNDSITCQGAFDNGIVKKYHKFNPAIEQETGYIKFWISDICRVVLT